MKHVKTDETEAEHRASAGRREASIEERIARLDTCRTALDAHGLAFASHLAWLHARHAHGT